MEGALSGRSAAGARRTVLAPVLAVAGLLFSGLVQAAISPPLGWVALHPWAWVPAFLVFARLRGWRALGAGWLVGASANAAIFYWIVHTVREFAHLPTPVGIAVLLLYAGGVGLYAGVFAWGFGAVRRAGGRFWPFAVAAWFTACEFGNPQLFPYFQGVAWYELSRVFLVVSLTGVAGVTFLVMACNGIVVQALEWLAGRGPARRTLLANAGLLLAGVAGAIAWSASRLAEIDRAEARTPPIRAALVQPNLGVARHAAMRRDPAGLAEDLVGLSRRALEEHGPLDVVVWPEKTLVRSPRHRHNRAVRELARAAGVEVWTGGDFVERPPEGGRRYYNSAFRVDAAGRQDRRFDKIVLLPFGEFMPLADVFPPLREVEGVGNYSSGTELPVYESPLGRFVFLICYEGILSDFVRRGVRGGAELLVNLTFDGWYGDTSEPSQHLMLAAVQSAQYGVPLLRSTTTGISAIVDARGRITARTGLFTREVLVGEVRPMHVGSPYAAWGEWFAWSCAGASALLLLRAWLSRRRPPAADARAAV